jgi:membrane protein YdbS with pleckstrin-like domain
MSEEPRPGEDEDDDDERRRQPPERNTEEFATVPSTGQVVEFDDYEFAPLGANEAGAGFDSVDLIATREPSDLVRRYLFPTEKFRGEWRRHWIHLAKRISIGVVATFALGYLSGYFAKENVTSGLTILVIIWVAVMGWVLWDVAEWYYDRFILTNKRIMLIEGIIARKVAMMPLARVTDMKYTQSPMGRVLGYGTFEIESAGQDQALRNVQNLPNPTDLYLQVVEEMYEPEASEARRRASQVGGDDA